MQTFEGDDAGFSRVQALADGELALRSMSQPRSYEDCCAQLRAVVLRMLSSTRVERYGAPSTHLRDMKIILASDYSGLGTAEFAAGELQVAVAEMKRLCFRSPPLAR